MCSIFLSCMHGDASQGQITRLLVLTAGREDGARNCLHFLIFPRCGLGEEKTHIARVPQSNLLKIFSSHSSFD